MTDLTRRRIKSLAMMWLVILSVVALAAVFVGICFLLAAIAPDWTLAVFVLGIFAIGLSLLMWFDE